MLSAPKESTMNFEDFIVLLRQSFTEHLAQAGLFYEEGGFSLVYPASQTQGDLYSNLLFRGCIALCFLPTTPLFTSLNNWEIFGLGSGKNQIRQGKGEDRSETNYYHVFIINKQRAKE